MTNVLIIEPSSSGLELIFTAKAMGLTTFIASANIDERIIPDEYHRHIDHLKIIDTYDIDSLYNWICNINHPISAIIPGSEYHVPITAQLAHKLGLPGINPEDVESLRIKSFMRDRLCIFCKAA
ncbi:TPA: hypothetical protein ACNBA3_002946 [Legionella pneumophila]|nr:hypothetical protein [Legionella pneumophila]HBD7173653.1 hypothetical protein [Legionella pneumophila]HCU5989937.1 hypothetical protein [Legionella pneumophila]HDP7979106.1 hypothetical protein [Legionella pneumophila]HEM6948549.1 hypothetical protein [Legionella pneumophila]